MNKAEFTSLLATHFFDTKSTPIIESHKITEYSNYLAEMAMDIDPSFKKVDPISLAALIAVGIDRVVNENALGAPELNAKYISSN